MAYEQVIQLPERSIGRSGRDLFLSDKDITIVMVPYENYSVFPKAVDELYRNLEIPFNLILIEGNAPEDVRVALERRQRQHGNMTIIYTNHCPALGNAFNLAMPHVKTPYALLIDNGIRLPKGTVESLFEAVKTHEAAVVCPKDSMVPRLIRNSNSESPEKLQTIRTFGYRPCFLIARDLVCEPGKLFDEFSNPVSLGIDLFYKISSRGLKMIEDADARIQTRMDRFPRSHDYALFRSQWSVERHCRSLGQLENAWGIRLEQEPAYENYIREKMKIAERNGERDSTVGFYLSSKTRVPLKRMFRKSYASSI